jgi:quinol monooxygenase YgiN
MTSERGTDGTVTVFCLLRPRPSTMRTLRESLLALVAPTLEEAGCLAYELYEEADGSLMLVETWRSADELTAHQQQPAVKEQFGDQLSELLAEDLDVHYSTRLSPTA